LFQQADLAAGGHSVRYHEIQAVDFQLVQISACNTDATRSVSEEPPVISGKFNAYRDQEQNRMPEVYGQPDLGSSTNAASAIPSAETGLITRAVRSNGAPGFMVGRDQHELKSDDTSASFAVVV